VLVHDAVRPCLSRADLDRLLDAGGGTRSGALLAAPVAETVKHADAAQCCERTVPREQLWRALTPQMFRYRRLCSALTQAQQAAREPTDEAQAIEWLGERPLLVAAAHSNPKITTAEDLAVAAAILAARE
jgi:2-C-methyl-D-erythritol 4-phosphate cytidylyltransferase